MKFEVLLCLILILPSTHPLQLPSLSSRRDLLISTPTLLSAPLLLPQPSLSLPTVPQVKCGSATLSQTIQGYWQLAGGHGEYDVPDVLNTMDAHYKAGITSFDTADIYGPSESIVGRYTKDRGIPVNTKLCVFDSGKITRASIRSRVMTSRDKLGKIDVMQFFWSNVNDRKFVDVSLWLSELRDEGMFCELGVTNFNLPSLKLMQSAGAGIRLNQVQSSCLDRRVLQSGQADYCAAEGIKVVSFGTVGSGILSDKYLGRGKPAGGEIDSYSMRMYTGTAGRFGSWDLVQELLSVLDVIAASVRSSGRCKSCSISNVAQRYVLQTDPTKGCLLVGVRNRNHIEDNVRTYGFELEEGEVKEIQKVVDKRKGPKGDVWDLERGFV